MFRFVAIDCSGAVMIRTADCGKQEYPGQLWEVVKAKFPTARGCIDQRNFDGDAIASQFAIPKPIIGHGNLPQHGDRFEL